MKKIGANLGVAGVQAEIMELGPSASCIRVCIPWSFNDKLQSKCQL